MCFCIVCVLISQPSLNKQYIILVNINTIRDTLLLLLFFKVILILSIVDSHSQHFRLVKLVSSFYSSYCLRIDNGDLGAM